VRFRNFKNKAALARLELLHQRKKKDGWQNTKRIHRTYTDGEERSLMFEYERRTTLKEKSKHPCSAL
jgi:hypothetical protein